MQSPGPGSYPEAGELAIIFLKCGLAKANLPNVLDDLATVSGYRELPVRGSGDTEVRGSGDTRLIDG